MAAPKILIDQGVLPAGVPGDSRRDLAVGVPVNVSDPENPTATVFEWELIAPPGSGAVLDSTIIAAPTFTPDIPGAYLLFLNVNSGELSYELDADGNKKSIQGGAGIELPNGTLAHGIGESQQFGLLGWGERFDELFPFLDQLRGISTGIGAGWVRITGITVPGGSTATPVFQDPPGDTILQSIVVSNGTFDVDVEASFPLVLVNGVPATLARVGDIYQGTVSTTIAIDGDVSVQVVDSNNVNGPADLVAVAIDSPPVLLTLSFLGGYPGTQTELKAGDTYQLTGTTDVAADAIEVQDFEASDAVQLLAFAPGTNFTVTMVVGDRGITLQALAASVRARSASTGALGVARSTNELAGGVDGIDLINLNNLFPGIALGAIVYPATQSALKGAETATIVNALTDFDTVAYDSPNGDLTVTLPAVSEDPKTVTRLAGAYNDSVNNFRITANRIANDATTVDQLVVVIANVAATLAVAEPAARLRSGGNDGTAPQDHTITITANQQLAAAPTLAPDAGPRGAFLAAFAGGPAVWTASLRVLDTDDKGVFNWGAILGTNLAGIPTAAITGDAQYTLGGFVARTLTFAAFATTAAMGVEVVDFTKLQAGTFTSTAGVALKQPIGTPPSVTNGFTIDALNINPTDVIWLDSPAAGANSGGTATITNVEEIV